jgi:uncharacterized protein (DUF1330 family)
MPHITRGSHRINAGVERYRAFERSGCRGHGERLLADERVMAGLERAQDATRTVAVAFDHNEAELEDTVHRP